MNRCPGNDGADKDVGAFVGTFRDGRSGEVDFPGFWTRDSGIKSPMTIADEKEAAAIICKSQPWKYILISSLAFASKRPD